MAFYCLSAASKVAARGSSLGTQQALLGYLYPRSYATGASESVIDVQSDKEFKNLIESEQDSKQLTVVDFTAKWCGPCRAMAPIYEQMSKDHPTVQFTKVDIDSTDLTATVEGHGITGVPTFVLYKGGVQLESFSGAQKDLLMQLVKKHK